MKKTLALLVALLALSPVVALANQGDWYIGIKDMNDDIQNRSFTDAPTSGFILPFMYASSDSTAFVSLDTTSGIKLTTIGGGNNKSVGLDSDWIQAHIDWNSIPDLQATMTTKASTSSVASSIATAISGLSSGSFNIEGYLNSSASTTPHVASSTPGFMSGAMVTKLNSLSTSTIDISYEGTTKHSGSFPIFKSVTISSGTGVVNLTADGTSGGTALCTNGVIQDSVAVIFNDTSSSFQQGWAFTNSNKTLTITANKFTTANILSGVLGQAAANGSVAKITVWCY